MKATFSWKREFDFPMATLGDGSANCYGTPERLVKVTRYSYEKIITPVTAEKAWRKALAEIPPHTLEKTPTEGQKRDLFRRFCAHAVGKDLY